MKKSLPIFLFCGLAAMAHADVTVNDPWVRATVAGQKATGAFMELKSSGTGKLVSATSPAAGIVEIHEMAMVGDVMKMRQIEGLALPDGKAVKLAPGGYHIMLMDLKKQLEPGQTVALELVIEGADGKREVKAVTAQVRPLGEPKK